MFHIASIIASCLLFTILITCLVYLYLDYRYQSRTVILDEEIPLLPVLSENEYRRELIRRETFENLLQYFRKWSIPLKLQRAELTIVQA